PAADQVALGGGKNAVGGGPDREGGGRADGLPAALAAYAEALGIDQSVAGDDAYGETRHVKRLHPAGNVGLDFRYLRQNAIRHGRFGSERFGRHRHVREVETDQRNNRKERTQRADAKAKGLSR